MIRNYNHTNLTFKPQKFLDLDKCSALTRCELHRYVYDSLRAPSLYRSTVTSLVER